MRDSLHGALDPDLRHELQRILYGLYAIIRLHFAKEEEEEEEEEVYLPLLDAALPPAEAGELFHAMHESVSESGSAHQRPQHH